MENSSPNPSFSICDIRIQKQISRSFGKSFPQKIVLPKLRPHCSATCPNTWRAEHHRKILFSLKEEKIGRAQNEKSKEYFSVVWRACRAVAGLASLLGVLLKKSSNINQKTPPIFTFCEIVRNSLGAKRLGMVFFRNFEGIFEIQKQSAVGNAEVRRAKLWQNEILQTNLFSFAFSERLSVFFFDCPKTNFKTIWTT